MNPQGLEVARVGIYGGTFNPIHLGHLRAAEEVVEELGLERIVFVPSAQPPHKSSTSFDPVAPASERLAWVRAATRDNPRFEVDALEIERGGPSFSVETLRTLGARLAPERPVFVLGWDAFVEIGTWREPEALFAMAHIAVTTRPPAVAGSLAQWLPEGVRAQLQLAPDGRSGRHRSAGTWLRFVPISALDVSASDIRARLRKGRSIRYLVPETVREAVEQSETYAGMHSG
jgi:nicotinate-nucleotide adenylyltransferase